MTDSRTADKFVLRMPNGMRQQIAGVAENNRRSMNSEIVARLDQSFQAPGSNDEEQHLVVRVLSARVLHLERLLSRCEAFMVGFDNDPVQDGLNELLMSIRATSTQEAFTLSGGRNG
ncbi:Arc family DNA-binding protein [Pseudomonas tohonis]|uniref:Arc family DNA-binding protein n=1 Tax=Pseudomonas tohonis TaxID=2725477 RepID=UPI0022F07786|nr:Arc family DNA-binding protein [Pseudomonas tohonis]